MPTVRQNRMSRRMPPAFLSTARQLLFEPYCTYLDRKDNDLYDISAEFSSFRGFTAKPRWDLLKAQHPGIAVCDSRFSVAESFWADLGSFSTNCVSLANMAPKPPYNCTSYSYRAVMCVPAMSAPSGSISAAERSPGKHSHSIVQLIGKGSPTFSQIKHARAAA